MAEAEGVEEVAGRLELSVEVHVIVTVASMVPLAQATFHLTEADAIALYRFTFQRSSLFETTYRRNWRNGLLAGVLVTAMSVVPFYLLTPNSTVAVRRALVVAAGSTVVWALYAYRTLTRRAFSRRCDHIAAAMVREGKVPFHPGCTQVLLYSSEIVWIEELTQRAIRWPAVERTTRQPDALYVETFEDVIMRLPWRAFPSSDEQQRFMVILDQRLAHRGT